MAGYPCYSEEKQIDLHEFANSPEVDFITKNGFDLDYEKIKGLISKIQEYIIMEDDNVMRLFD